MRCRFDVVLVWACDRLARSTKHLLQTIDELNGMGIQFLSQREAIDTEGPLGRAILVIVSAMAELERCIIIERVRAGMRRARLEGRQIGRARLDVDREQVVIDRRSGMSLTQVAKKHGISRASVCRLMKEANASPDATVPALAGSVPGASERDGGCSSMNSEEEMEDSMFDEPFVTTAEEIKQAREALLKLGREIARRGTVAEFNEAQIVFANANARMELAAPGDDDANKAAEAANRRLFALFKKGWTRGNKLLFDCYREYKKRLCYHHQAEG
jgi:hypothetical protein